MERKEISKEQMPDLFSLVDSLDWGISIFDEHGKFVWVNRYVLNVSGRPRKFFLGKSPADIKSLGILDVPVATQVLETGRKEIHAQSSYSQDGTLKHFVVTATPIFDSEGKIRFVVADRIELKALKKRYDIASQEKENSKKPKKINSGKHEKIIFKSALMKKAVSDARRAAEVASVILLTGESGTGKEVFANFIHDCSPHSAGSMIEINCASMPESLLESELFGYVKGAFTGASKEGKMGLIEAADKGTLFLDEINSMPLGLQAKLLRVLETKEITRLGSTKPVKVDFRLLAATNKDLMTCVEEKTFRSDLYYRLNVIPINLPPLRERKEDIALLTDFFLQKYCEQYELEKKFSRKVYRTFADYSWPGNVRELKNVVERMVIMSTKDTLTINEVPKSMLCQKALPGGVGEIEDEKERIMRALELNDGHREKTAGYLNISRRTLQYKIKKYGLK